LLEQKYQINNQLFPGATVVYFFVVEFVQANHSSARSAGKMEPDQKQLAEWIVLDRLPPHVC